MRRLVGAAALLLLLAGCADDGTAGGTATQPATEDGLVAAATAMHELLLDGRYADTYDHLTAECQQAWTQDEWASNLDGAVAAFETFEGRELGSMSIDAVTVEDLTGGSASVRTDLRGPDGEPLPMGGAGAPWVYQDGRWRAADCEAASD